MTHLDSLDVLDGTLLYHKTKRSKSKPVDTPESRAIFHLPNENLYYMQTALSNKVFSIDNISCTIQMTFGANAQHIFLIMKQMILSPLLNHTNDMSSAMQLYMDNLAKKIIAVENTVQQLSNEYSKNMKNCHFCKDAKFITYISLLLFKIMSYYSYAKADKDKKRYFKNFLFFNVRHSNYQLYIQLCSIISKEYPLLTHDECAEN